MNSKQNTSQLPDDKSWTIDLLTSVMIKIFDLVKQNGAFALTLILTIIFYFPALKSGSVNAGFLYMGDNIGLYWTSLAKMQSLISSLNFMAIDFSSFNGSSDYFLATNVYGYHPMIVIYSLLFSAESTSIQSLGQLLVWMLAIHTFIACYFSIKLLTRFFSLDFWSAVLAATIFAFSIMMVNVHGEPQILFAISVFPWAAYEALVYRETPQHRRLIFACLPIIISFMSGYLPLSVAALALSVVLVAIKIFVLDESSIPLNARLRIFSVGLLPFICGSLVVSPYLYSAYEFLQTTPSANKASLFFSAHQLAEHPQSFIRLLSFNFSVPGPYYEFSLAWGFIAVTIGAIFLLSPKALDAVSSQEWKSLKIFSIIYFATTLAIFGNFSVVSDLVYYFVPQVGNMHIYQRFLLPSHLLFGVILAFMLKAIVQARPPFAIRVSVVLLLVTTFVLAYLVGRNPNLSQQLGIDNYIIFELLLASLFAISLLIPGKSIVYFAAIVLIFLPTLDRMYDYSHGGNTLQEQRKRQLIALDETKRASLVSYFKRLSNKEIIKYVDLTPRWTKDGVEYFPKSFPYLVLNELQMSSYTGFNFYLSSRLDYMRKMPIDGANVSLNPDWEMIQNTGADFIIAIESNIHDGPLSIMLAKTKQEDMYRLPNDVIIFPFQDQTVKPPSTSTVFDNGYIKVSPTRPEAAKLVNIALKKIARQSSNYHIFDAKLAVDGNTDGDLNHGSVSHTGSDPNAWFEIDLGSVEPIDNVKVWNRTDCCRERLSNYWIFISDSPFLASDTASKLRARPSTWGSLNFSPMQFSTIKTGGVRGRYVRIQLNGSAPADRSYLSLAEVEVYHSDMATQNVATLTNPNDTSDFKVNRFHTNNANYLLLDISSSAPETVQYLFFDNPRLSYFLNGQRATVFEKDGLRTINVPSGRNTIEIRYKHWPLAIFWVFYITYTSILFWFLIPYSYINKIRKKWITEVVPGNRTGG
jgi:hypothetical protein